MVEPDFSAATMIAADGGDDRAALLRTSFALDRPATEVASAQLHITALGVYEAEINATPVSDEVLAPGWSSYERRLRYRSHDVTALLRDESVLGVRLGNGWAAGRLAFAGNSHYYADEPGVIAVLTITWADGTQQSVTTDETWQSAAAPTRENQLYDGQVIDARIPSQGWSSTDPSPEITWSGVHAVEFDRSRLAAPIGPPVVRHESLSPQKIWQSPSGRTLVDFGQNLVGWVRLRHHGESGQSITVRHAEVLEHEELGTRPLRSAKATDTFICSGGDDVFEPTMTFHGFRYAEVEGIEDLTPEALEAVVVHSKMERIGHFECSDELVNQLHRNVVWGQRGNFLDVPTDCPQRDERLGWTGDLSAFATTAVFNYDVETFLRDWLADLAVEQEIGDGVVPHVVPDVLKFERREGRPSEVTCLWSDAACWVPWAVWTAYGDPTVLRESLPSMAAHLDRIRSVLSPTGLWDTGFQYGDWLDPTAPPEDPFKAKADPGVVATACAHRSARIAADAATVLGETEQAAGFARFADELRTAFNQHYVHDGVVTTDCPTVYALAIAFDLLDEADRTAAGNRLAELARENQFRVATGFAGTPFVCDALADTGHLDEAYALLTEKSCPSWLYPVTMGATTIWERWDSMLPDGSINPGQMTSFNHYAFGAIADFLHRVVGGLVPAEPGYRSVTIAPRPGGGITSATTSLESRQGPISVSWQLDDQLHVTIDLPDGVSGTFHAPDGTTTAVSGHTEVSVAAP